MGDCYNWVGCQANCEDCVLTNMDDVQTVKAWTESDMLKYPPDEILHLLQRLVERIERLEQEDR